MIVLILPLLLLLLVVIAVKAKNAGRSGGEVTLIVVFGLLGIVAAMFGILVWGFSGFG
jgi:cation transporter-like permease